MLITRLPYVLLMTWCSSRALSTTKLVSGTVCCTHWPLILQLPCNLLLHTLMPMNGTFPGEKIFRESHILAWNGKGRMKFQKEKYREDEQKKILINFSATKMIIQGKHGNLDSWISLPLTMLNTQSTVIRLRKYLGCKMDKIGDEYYMVDDEREWSQGLLVRNWLMKGDEWCHKH